MPRLPRAPLQSRVLRHRGPTRCANGVLRGEFLDWVRQVRLRLRPLSHDPQRRVIQTHHLLRSGARDVGTNQECADGDVAAHDPRGNEDFGTDARRG